MDVVHCQLNSAVFSIVLLPPLWHGEPTAWHRIYGLRWPFWLSRGCPLSPLSRKGSWWRSRKRCLFGTGLRKTGFSHNFIGKAFRTCWVGWYYPMVVVWNACSTASEGKQRLTGVVWAAVKTELRLVPVHRVVVRCIEPEVQHRLVRYPLVIISCPTTLVQPVGAISKEYLWFLVITAELTTAFSSRTPLTNSFVLQYCFKGERKGISCSRITVYSCQSDYMIRSHLKNQYLKIPNAIYDNTTTCIYCVYNSAMFWIHF